MGCADKLEDTLAVDPNKLRRLSEELKDNREWKNAIVSDCLSGLLLRYILNQTFSQQSKEVENLFDCSMKQNAKFAYAIGIINKTTLGDLKLINDIRNKFAHSEWPISFADSEVRNICKGLSTAKGSRITTNNSYKIYDNAVSQCLKNIITAKKRKKFLKKK